MTLFSAQRRFLAVALVAALIAPAAAMPFLPRQTVSPQENRVLAQAPEVPRTAAQWRAAPRAVDAYLADHFGFRQPLMTAASRGWRELGGDRAGAEAVEGRDGWMFLTDGLLASTGQVVNAERARDYGAFVCELAARLQANGADLLFAMPPSPAQIYPEKAPAWAGVARRPTDHDLILAEARACGVPTADLRPDLIAAKREGQVYRQQDSHWTLRGSLTAYDRLVEAMGRRDWRIAPQTLQWGRVEMANGDLPRLVGRDAPAENVEIHNLTALPPEARRRPLAGLRFRDKPPFIVETGRPGPTVLILGDSFTADPLPPYFAPFVGRIAWVHHDECAFDWRVVDRVKPDHVLLLPTEREARCHGARPLGWAK